MLLILLSSDAGQFVFVSWFRRHKEGGFFSCLLLLFCFGLDLFWGFFWFVLFFFTVCHVVRLHLASMSEKLKLKIINKKTETKWKTHFSILENPWTLTSHLKLLEF